MKPKNTCSILHEFILFILVDNTWTPSARQHFQYFSLIPSCLEPYKKVGLSMGPSQINYTINRFFPSGYTHYHFNSFQLFDSGGKAWQSR